MPPIAPPYCGFIIAYCIAEVVTRAKLTNWISCIQAAPWGNRFILIHCLLLDMNLACHCNYGSAFVHNIIHQMYECSIRVCQSFKFNL